MTEPKVEFEAVDVVIDNDVVLSLTIEVRKDMVRELGSANYWKMLIQKMVEKHLPEIKLRNNIQ
jgi:hypothetical protein